MSKIVLDDGAEYVFRGFTVVSRYSLDEVRLKQSFLSFALIQPSLASFQSASLTNMVGSL